jgi:hypothetical protein
MRANSAPCAPRTEMPVGTLRMDAALGKTTEGSRTTPTTDNRDPAPARASVSILECLSVWPPSFPQHSRGRNHGYLKTNGR